MSKLRNLIRVLTPVLLFGLTVGIAHADNSSTDAINLEPRNQPVTENLVAAPAIDSSVTADAESLEPAVEPDCASEMTVMAALGIETVVSMTEASSAWTCGSCSVSVCANKPVGTACWAGGWKYCVVTTICSAQPLTERCVCGWNHA